MHEGLLGMIVAPGIVVHADQEVQVTLPQEDNEIYLPTKGLAENDPSLRIKLVKAEGTTSVQWTAIETTFNNSFYAAHFTPH